MALEPVVKNGLSAVEGVELVIGPERLGVAVVHQLLEGAPAGKASSGPRASGRAIEQGDEPVPLGFVQDVPVASAEN